MGLFKKKQTSLTLDERLKVAQEGIDACIENPSQESAEEIINHLLSINFSDADLIQEAVIAFGQGEGGIGHIRMLYSHHLALTRGDILSSMGASSAAYNSAKGRPVKLDVGVYLSEVKKQAGTSPEEVLAALGVFNHFSSSLDITNILFQIDSEKTLSVAIPQYFNHFSEGMSHRVAKGLNVLMEFNERVSDNQYKNIKQKDVVQWTNALVQSLMEPRSLQHTLQGGVQHALEIQGPFGDKSLLESYYFNQDPPSQDVIDATQDALNDVDQRNMLGETAPRIGPVFASMVQNFYVPDQREILVSAQATLNQLSDVGPLLGK